MPTPQQEIKRLYELSKEIRENAQHKYVQGRQDEAMDDARYADGIERAVLEIATLNSIATAEMGELKILDQGRLHSPSIPDNSTEDRDGSGSEPASAHLATRLTNQATRRRSHVSGIRLKPTLR